MSRCCALDKDRQNRLRLNEENTRKHDLEQNGHFGHDHVMRHVFGSEYDIRHQESPAVSSLTVSTLHGV